MKKTLIILICILFLVSFAYSKGLELPKNVKIIGLNCAAYNYIQTVIDLDNNELVIINYAVQGVTFRLNDVIRTGIIVNPKDYEKIALNDSMFPKDK